MIRALIERISEYDGLFFACAGSGLVVPVPEDIVLLYAGMKVGGPQLQWAPALAVACAGVLLRDVIAYWIGRLIGEWLLGKRWFVRLFGRRKLARARRMVEEREAGAVVVGRFLVGMRAPVFMVAGAAGIGFRRFVLLDALGVLVAVPVAVVLGHLFGEPLIDAAFWIMRSSRVLLAIVVVLGGIAWWRWRGKRRARRDSTDS